MKPHIHAELIKAWADGAKIQAKLTRTNEWIDVVNFNWSEDYEFRIKPEEKKPVVHYLWAVKHSKAVEWHQPMFFRTESEMQALFSGDTYIKLDWSRTEFPE